MNDISRRSFISRISFAAAGTTLLGYSYRYPFQNDYIEAATYYGKLRGYRENGVSIFKGIPYAGRISGDRRFRRPAPLEPWSGIRESLQLGNPSIQPPNQTYGINEPEMNEDCLFLNVWTPACDNQKRPVMFYNHGGGFSTGS